MSMASTPLLSLLKKLEVQNIWRMSTAIPGLSAGVQSGQHGFFSSAPFAQFQQQQQQAAVPLMEHQGPEWYENQHVSAHDALKLLVNRIQQTGPVKQRHLQALYQRCQTEEELEKALKLTRLNYLARGELKQHKPFSHKTSQVLIHQALNVGAPEVAKKALKFADEFGLSHDSYKEFHPLIIYYSKQGDLQRMFEVFEFMKVSGRRPGPETCYILVKGCVDQGRPDLAELVIREFEQNGVRVRDGTKLYLVQNRDKVQQAMAARMAAAGASMPGASA